MAGAVGNTGRARSRYVRAIAIFRVRRGVLACSAVGNESTSMEMHQARYFVALCETLNFTRAAEKCNVTQPRSPARSSCSRTSWAAHCSIASATRPI